MSRIETDSLGNIEVPDNVLYGAFTTRASKNFRISGIKANPEFIRSLAITKKHVQSEHQAQHANEPSGDVIIQAADDIIEGKYRDQFILDVFQAGAGTPFI